MRCKLKLSPSKHMVYLFKMSARKYLSGAANRKLKKQRIESDSKRRRTLEDLGWRPSSLTTPECTDQNDDDNGFDNMEQESNDSTESDVSSHNTSHEENPSLNDTTTVSNDPFKWKSELTSDQRIEIVKPLAKRPTEIVQSLHKLKEHLDLPAEFCSEVDGLLKWLTSFELSLLISFWYKALQAINEVNIMVQSSKVTLDEASKLLNSLLEDMKLLRNNWQHVLEESKLVATNLGFATEFAEKRRKRRKKRLFSQSGRTSPSQCFLCCHGCNH